MPTRKRTTARSVKNKDYLRQLESYLENIFASKAPGLPKGLKKFIVDVGPWLMLIGLILALPLILAALGLTAFFAPFALMMKAKAPDFGLQVLISTAVLALNALALPGLFQKKLSSWRLLFYASLLAAFDRLVSFELTSFLVGALVSWYILFQVKSYYK